MRRPGLCVTAVLLAAGLWGLAGPVQAGDVGTKRFVARPVIGKARPVLASVVRWSSAPRPDGSVDVAIDAEADVQPVLADIRTLSALALDRNPPCKDNLKVTAASAKIIGPRALTYKAAFHYAKRLCAGGMPMDIPADISCVARIDLSAQQAVIVMDVKEGATPACTIAGAYQGMSQALVASVGRDVFKPHAVDLASLLPPAFKGVAISVTSIGFDQPPARAKFHLMGTSVMSPAQYQAFQKSLQQIGSGAADRK